KSKGEMPCHAEHFWRPVYSQDFSRLKSSLRRLSTTTMRATRVQTMSFSTLTGICLAPLTLFLWSKVPNAIPSIRCQLIASEHSRLLVVSRRKTVAASMLVQEGTRSLPSLLGREILQKSKELCDSCTVLENSTALAVTASIKTPAPTRPPVQQTWRMAAIASGVHTQSNRAARSLANETPTDCWSSYLA